jgi:gamma-glutamyltranspeptidase/glutathione hydrolase
MPLVASAQKTAKPVLHGTHWAAITGKPLAASAGAMMFARGGNAIDAACAMLGATSTMWDTLGWGGETQALIYNPETGKVIGINALGVAPTGATPEFFREQGMVYPPEYGPLAAVTPGTPGGLMVMLAEYGRLSLAEVLEPSIEMAEGYPIEAVQATTSSAAATSSNSGRTPPACSCRISTRRIRAARRTLPGRAVPPAGSAATLQKLVDTEAEALAAGKSRKEAIYAAYERFYRGDIAAEIVRASREHGGLFTREDLANWEVHLEEPVSTNYGHRCLQADHLGAGTGHAAGPEHPRGHRPQRHGLQQRQLHSHAVPDHEPGLCGPRLSTTAIPTVPPAEPVAGPAVQGVRGQRRALINPERNDPDARPGDPYPFQGEENPFQELLDAWTPIPPAAMPRAPRASSRRLMSDDEASSPARRLSRQRTPTAG